MSLKSKKILGISVTTSSRIEILEELEKYLEKRTGKPLVIATANPEQIVYAQRDMRFAKLLDQADVAIPDGIGLAWAAGAARIPGVELMEELVRLAALRGYGIALIGGRGAVAVAALECLQRKYPGLVGWAKEPGEIQYNGYNDYNYYNCYKKIKKTNTRLVFVGLGAPKQEYFIEAISHQLSAIRRSEDGRLKTDDSCILMSVGGSFDMIAGRVPRATRAIQAFHLEWLWRLIREPWRWRRQLALVKFLWLVLEEKLASQGSTLRS